MGTTNHRRYWRIRISVVGRVRFSSNFRTRTVSLGHRGLLSVSQQFDGLIDTFIIVTRTIEIHLHALVLANQSPALTREYEILPWPRVITRDIRG